jgi:hypothetical protein
LAEDRQQLKSILIELGLLDERSSKGSVLYGHT